MIDRRSRSYFRPEDPEAVRSQFKRIAARAARRIEHALSEIKPPASTPSREFSVGRRRGASRRR